MEVEVIVPEGCVPGDLIYLDHNGQTVAVTVPEGAPVGSVFVCQMPNGTFAHITVPPGATPGTQITVDIPLNTQVVVEGIPLE